MQLFLSKLTHVTYKWGVKPFLFTKEPEKAHRLMIQLGKVVTKIAVTPILMKGIWSYQDKKLMKKIDGITFPNPVGLAAGFDYDADLLGTLPSIGFGFHTIGTITLHPYDGNPPPRLTRLIKSKSILVNKGLKNIGAVAIIEKLKDQKMLIPTGVSIASTNRQYKSETEQISEIIECFVLFEKSKLQHSYYELNISCPNTFGGEPFTTPVRLEKLIKQMDRLRLTRPLYVKMPIDYSEAEIVALLKVLDIHNVQGVIFGNLTKDKHNPAVHPLDLEVWQKMPGNLSGKPTFHRSNTCIKWTRTYFGSRFTIIGTGGIFSGSDAWSKIRSGADLVQLITGMIYEGPQLIGQINSYLAHKGKEI